MIRWLCAVLVLLLTGCGPRRVSSAPDPPKPDTSGALRLVGYQRGFGQGCPIDATALLTARHVATEDNPLDGSVRRVYAVWSDQTGHASGSVWLEDFDLRRDLARMRSDRPFPHVYRLATTAPAIGDKVTIAGFARTSFEPKTIATEVVDIISAHVVLADSGEPGFSGSCVWNSRGEVVAIFHWGLTRGTRQFGIASAVYGEWADVGWLPPRR